MDRKLYYTRSATLNDLQILLEFEQCIITAERPFDATLAKDPITYYDMKELITSNASEVIVVIYKEEVIASGYAKVKPANSYLRHKQYAYLGFMYTKPNHRGVGVNGLIIQELRKWAIKQELNEIRLTVYEENDAAIKAYEKAGFKKHLVEMRIT